MPFLTNSHKERALSQYSPIAFIDMTIRMMAYPLTLGSISWALSWVISYLRLTYEIATSLQLYTPYGIALGALTLKVTMVAIAARFLIAAISQLFGLGLDGRRNGYSDGLRGAMKGVAAPVIIASIITLAAGLFSAGPSLIELVKTGIEASIDNPWLVVLLPFYQHAAGQVFGIIVCAAVLVVVAGYWLASKLGLDTTKILYNKTQVELDREEREAEIARSDAFFGPSSAFHSSNRRQDYFQDEVSIKVGSGHTMHKDSNAIKFTNVLSDTVTAILGGVVDAVVPGR